MICRFLLLTLFSITVAANASADWQSQCDIPAFQQPSQPFAGLNATYNIRFTLNPDESSTNWPFASWVCFHEPSAQGALWHEIASAGALNIDLPIPKPNGEILAGRVVVAMSGDGRFYMRLLLRSDDVDYGPIVPGFARWERHSGVAGFFLSELAPYCGTHPSFVMYTAVRWNSGPPSYIHINVDSIVPTSGKSELVYLKTNFNPSAANYSPPPTAPLVDSDGDSTLDCNDACPDDAEKTAPGICGCGVPEAEDPQLCGDACPEDPEKMNPGLCGCGIAETEGCESFLKMKLPAPSTAVEGKSAQIVAQEINGASTYEFTLTKRGAKSRVRISKTFRTEFRRMQHGRWSAHYRIVANAKPSKPSPRKFFSVQ